MTENQKKPPPSHILRSCGLPSKGGMWRVIYSVSPRTPEEGQAGKGDKPPPLHIPSYCWIPQRGGMWRVIYWESPRTPEGGQAGKGDKPPPLYILRSRGAHIQLLLATFKEGELVTEKGRNDEG